MAETNQYEEMGKRWLRGEIDIEDYGDYIFNPKQKAHINGRSRFELVNGGMASGKTLSWQVKFLLITQWFPGTSILIGRKTKHNAVSTFMKDFVDVCPPEFYDFKVGEGKMIFSNGTQAIFFGLDALQGGNGDDLKKAMQDLKSHNFGFVFIDQLEEIEMKVFEALNSRMRRRQCKHNQTDQIFWFNDLSHIDGAEYARWSAEKQDQYSQDHQELRFEQCKACDKYTFNQMNFTSNPANYWAYDYFKSNPRRMTHLVETSMMDNKAFLSSQFIQSELAKPKRYVQKYVYGEWSPDSLVDGGVFAEDYVKAQEFNIKEPVRAFDGIQIYKEADHSHEYQIGVDPSEGAIDPCCVQVVDKNTGEQVAKYTGFLPVGQITEKIMVLVGQYMGVKKPLVVCESQGGGQAVIEDLKKVYTRIYEREVFNVREKRQTKKLGFNTNYATKTQLIGHMEELFQKKYAKIRARSTLLEMKTFIYTDEVSKKGASAQRGYHDDEVMAMMLAYWNIEGRTVKEQSLLDRKTRHAKKRVVKYAYE